LINKQQQHPLLELRISDRSPDQAKALIQPGIHSSLQLNACIGPRAAGLSSEAAQENLQWAF
jgi:hypothetical protein